MEKKKLEEEEVEWKKRILTQKDLDQLDKNNLSQQELKQLKKYTNIYENIDIIGNEILSLGRTDFKMLDRKRSKEVFFFLQKKKSFTKENLWYFLI